MHLILLLSCRCSARSAPSCWLTPALWGTTWSSTRGRSLTPVSTVARVSVRKVKWEARVWSWICSELLEPVCSLCCCVQSPSKAAGCTDLLIWVNSVILQLRICVICALNSTDHRKKNNAQQMSDLVSICFKQNRVKLLLLRKPRFFSGMLNVLNKNVHGAKMSRCANWWR